MFPCIGALIGCIPKGLPLEWELALSLYVCSCVHLVLLNSTGPNSTLSYTPPPLHSGEYRPNTTEPQVGN